MFKTMAGIQIRHVPYKAAAAIRIDLWEGRIDMVFGPESSALKELTPNGRARALMVSGTTRSTLFPSVPTADEVGLKGYDVTIWFGLNAPAGTPAPVVERLNRELNVILASPEMLKELASDGQVPRPMTPQQYGAFLNQERAKWIPAVKASGAKAE
jgi:tripartite-type tricarboxylate transporter receptor subunit TctC